MDHHFCIHTSLVELSTTPCTKIDSRVRNLEYIYKIEKIWYDEYLCKNGTLHGAIFMQTHKGEIHCKRTNCLYWYYQQFYVPHCGEVQPRVSRSDMNYLELVQIPFHSWYLPDGALHWQASSHCSLRSSLADGKSGRTAAILVPFCPSACSRA